MQHQCSRTGVALLALIGLGSCHGRTSQVDFLCTYEEGSEKGGLEVLTYSELSLTCQEFCEQGWQVLGGQEAHCEGALPDSTYQRDCDCDFAMPPECERWMRNRPCND